MTKIRRMHLARCLALAMAMLAVAGCAPQSPDAAGAAATTDSDQPLSVEFAWSKDADCSLCHETESASMDDGSYPASIHQREGSTCSSCHDDETGLGAAHAGTSTSAKTPSRLSKTAMSEQTCLGCHESRQTLAARTEASLLEDANGTLANPHALPASSGHDDLTCSDCHKMHKPDEAKETAERACLGCHHEGVFECYTCHE